MPRVARIVIQGCVHPVTRHGNDRQHGRIVHLWQNRFHSCALDEEHYRRAMQYGERKPARARRVRMARSLTCLLMQ